MPPITRREFLKTLSAALGATTAANLLSACGGTASGQGGTQPAMRPAAATQAANANSTLTNSSANAPAAAPAGTPDLVVARQGQPEALVREAIDALGGMKRFVSPGASVVIKPNICVAYHTYEYAATTNPTVVATLVTMCLGAGAKRVRVMDMPFGGTPESAYNVTGIADAVKQAGGEMEVMSRVKFVNTTIPQGKDITAWEIYQDILKADVLINVPIAKHHSLARLSLGGKNLLGTVSKPSNIHRNLDQRIADLASLIRPTLSVVDAVRILKNHGPTGGSLNDVEQTNTIIASHDLVAADAYAATLFGKTGTGIAYIKACADMGLGTLDLKSVKVEEINV